MTTQNTGGPAFPSPEWSDAHGNIAPMEYGMTLRDYFAAKAMQALLTSCDVSRQGYSTELDRRAVQAFLMADAMMKARGA